MKRNLLGLETLETRETPSRFGAGFTFTPVTLNLVSGSVFADANGNGARDAGENGVSGVRVYVDVNNNGARDANEPTAVTQSNLISALGYGQIVTTDTAGSFSINSVQNGLKVGGPVRVELPEGATLTAPVQTASALSNSGAFPIGLQGVTGTPNVTTTSPNSSNSISFGSSSSSVSGSLWASGSSSASVSAFSSSGPNGVFASATGSVSGNATAIGIATATGAAGTITSIFVG